MGNTAVIQILHCVNPDIHGEEYGTKTIQREKDRHN